MEKLNFQQPILQSSVSRDPSEIILICKKKSLIIIKVEESYFCLTFFVETDYLYFFFTGFFEV